MALLFLGDLLFWATEPTAIIHNLPDLSRSRFARVRRTDEWRENRNTLGSSDCGASTHSPQRAVECERQLVTGRIQTILPGEPVFEKAAERPEMPPRNDDTVPLQQ